MGPMKEKIGRATPYECIREESYLKMEWGLSKNNLIAGDCYNLMKRIEFAPRFDDASWKALPLEKRYLEVKGGMGGRNFISPFDMYGAWMERNAEIR